jgi:CRP-like cAMP-binding protein
VDILQSTRFSILDSMCADEVTVFRDGNHNPGATIFTSANSAMRAPYGLTILDNCVTCPIREEYLFCNLPLPAVKKLNEIKSTAIYPKSTMLFIEGQQPRGVFVLCTGKAKLSTSSSEGKTIITKISGKTIITKISEPGDVLGLNATISNHPYEVTTSWRTRDCSALGWLSRLYG